MPTRQIIFTAEELRLMSIWANNAEHDISQDKMLTRPDSPQEHACEADQIMVRGIQAKLAGRDPLS